MSNYEVIIAGAGPAGCSSALQLLNLDPQLAGRVLLLDKAQFPRAKLCAGRLSPDADRALSQLGPKEARPTYASTRLSSPCPRAV